MHGEASTWSTEAHLLAAAVDALQALIWQQSKKGTPRPRPVPRPGARGTMPGQSTYGQGGGVTVEEFERRRLERQRRKEVAADGD